MSTPLTPSDTIKLLDTAIKNNNEWFYERPDTQSSFDQTYRFAGKYFELASRWTMLNKASIEALKTIQDQREEIIKLECRVAFLDKTVNRLNTEITTLTNSCKETL